MNVNNLLAIALLLIIAFACDKDEQALNNENDDRTWTIRVGAFTLDNGAYTATGHELVFHSKEDCQTWSRTAQGDQHDANAHLHYNAATDVDYDHASVVFSWTEYGPEISQSLIETTCDNGLNGARKTVSEDSYYQDKPNLYLKITSVVEH